VRRQKDFQNQKNIKNQENIVNQENIEEDNYKQDILYSITSKSKLLKSGTLIH